MEIYEDKFTRINRPFKHIKGENGTTLFLPMNMKIGRPINVRYVKDKEVKCLTEDQERHTYKKGKSESVVNVDTVRQDIEDDKLTIDKEDGVNLLPEDSCKQYRQGQHPNFTNGILVYT